MQYEQHLRAVSSEIAAIDAALAAGGLDATVPSCPGWTLADLALHLGEFAGWWTHVLREATAGDTSPSPEAPDGDARAGWCATAFAELEAELAATPPGTTVWTWVEDDKSARFVARRCANELAIHRYDAQLARGAGEAIEPDLACDGIDEIFVMITNRGDTFNGSGETLHLHATDRDAEWMLTMHADRIDVRHEHGKGDAAIRGTVSDIELLLYGRPPLGSIEQFGDSRPLALFRETFEF